MISVDIRSSPELKAILDALRAPGLQVMGAVRETFVPGAPVRIGVLIKDGPAGALLAHTLCSWWLQQVAPTEDGNDGNERNINEAIERSRRRAAPVAWLQVNGQAAPDRAQVADGRDWVTPLLRSG